MRPFNSGYATIRAAALLLVGATAAACASGNGQKGGNAQASYQPAPPAAVAPSGMMLASQTSTAAPAGPAYVAAAGAYRDALTRAYREWKETSEGKNADYIPALAQVNPDLYGITLVTVEGAIYEIGNSKEEFSIQSISKPFTFARAVEGLGIEEVQKRIGVNATGQKFNSILAIELNQSQKRPPAGNPFVNAGAIATVDLVPAANATQKWDVILGMYSAFAGRKLTVDETIYQSESETNTHNRAIVQLLKDYEVLRGDPAEALDLYTRQCSVKVNARDLAVMGATLANGGRNPLTRQQVVSPATASQVLAVMATAGLYETSGDWLVSAGVPAKSGVGGGIVAVLPGRYAVGTFSPRLDDSGNSVRGQKAIEAIVKRLGGGVFAARSTRTRPASTAQDKGSETGTTSGGN